MKNFYFKDRGGQTPLPSDLQSGLIPKHIQTMGELDEYEEANISIGTNWLESQHKKQYLKYQFWQLLHKKLFSEVWKWAGKIRENELDNPYFVHPSKIWPEIKKLEDNIESWLEYQSFSERQIAAKIHERLLTIHPFPNGNGRFSRILVEYICQERGWPVPTWSMQTNDNPAARRREYVDSLNEARENKNHNRLEKFMFSK